jgi:hypothetical protein
MIGPQSAGPAISLFVEKSSLQYALKFPVPPRREFVWKQLNLRDDRVAGELGFEPRLTESESAVLPLNYSPISPFNQIVIQVMASRLAVAARFDDTLSAFSSRAIFAAFQVLRDIPASGEWLTSA